MPDKILVLDIAPSELLLLDLDADKTERAEKYDGEYIVTPSVEQQTLATADKLLTDDVTVKEIPFYEVSNNSGGTTVYIGNEVEI